MARASSQGAGPGEHDTPPACPFCGAPTPWQKKKKRFAAYCSARCYMEDRSRLRKETGERRRRAPAVLEVTDKRCSACCRRKPLSEFTADRGRSDGLSHYCRDCKKKKAAESRARHREELRRRQRQWARDHPEKIKETRRAWYEKNKHRSRQLSFCSTLKLKYGLTLEEYDALIESQSYVCAICGGLPECGENPSRASLNIDHDHTTGKVRGLLCFQCNVGIGNFDDSPDLLRKAATYLERHREAEGSMRAKVYIAGAISKGDLSENISRGSEAMLALMRAGYAPFCPMLSCYLGGDTPEVLPAGTTHEDWMGVDLPWVAVSDAVLRLPGESAGADREVDLANRLGIPVFLSLGELLAALRPRRAAA